jgi:hypothetical protein
MSGMRTPAFLVFLALVVTVAPDAGADEPAWRVEGGLGLTLPLGRFSDYTPLDAQLDEMGYDTPLIGVTLGLGLKRRAISLYSGKGILNLGLEAEYAYMPGSSLYESDHNIRTMPPGVEETAYVFESITGWVHLEFLLGGFLEDSFVAGVQLGMGAGSWMWTLRGETESAPLMALSLATIIGYNWENLYAGVRVGFPVYLVEPIGPYRLDHSVISGILDARVGWHW